MKSFGLVCAVVLAVGSAVAAAKVPCDLAAHDLTPLKDLVVSRGATVAVADGKAALPIVGGGFAASYLAKTIAEATGVKPPVVGKAEGPAFRLVPAKDGDGSFRIVSDATGVRFEGNVEFAVYDFCERVLGVRTYHEKGRCVPKAKALAVPFFSYSDRPVFPHRLNWPYEWQEWNRALKNGSTYLGGVQVHAPINWNADKELVKAHPEIFALTPDGRRAVTPLLCYGNPATLAYYQERILADIAGKRPSGVIDKRKKTITVSQWDCGVSCACEHCRKLFREDLGATGSGSPIIWGFFTKELAKWAKRELPGWKIAILPYINTCDVPPGLSFTEEGNVEAQLCTMPGLANLKNPATKKAEEDLIRTWTKCTGHKVMNWHYSCWPSEFTSAPYVFGKVIRAHSADMRDELVGTFINGPFDTQRLGLSVYVWMKCLWNPDVDVEAIYDGYAARMFGTAAKPMRELIRLQEDGWMRPWKSNTCSNRNVYDISYPRTEVLKMIALLAEAEKLAADDPVAGANVAWYKGGFEKFFEESERMASGTGYEPLVMKKAVAAPVVDGALDDPAWQAAEPRRLVSAKNLKDTKPLVATEARAVWTEEGVTFGFRCEEPDGTAVRTAKNNLEIFFDVTGETGHYCQVILDAGNRVDIHTDGFLWVPKGIRTAVKLGADAWTAEVFVPYSDLRGLDGAQIPTSAAGGRYWAGNFIRWRDGKSGLDHSRLSTRAHAWNNDAAAFSKFSFIE